MANFTVRMVLHDASPEDYKLLTEQMFEVGFLDIIRSDKGRLYKLPDAEYTGSAADLNAAMALCTNAAKVVGKKYEILVTESAGRIWVLNSA